MHLEINTATDKDVVDVIIIIIFILSGYTNVDDND